MCIRDRAISLIEAGYDSLESLSKAEKSELIKVSGVDRTNARRIRVFFEKQQDSEEKEICPLCGAVAETGSTSCKRCGTPFLSEKEKKEVIVSRPKTFASDTAMKERPLHRDAPPARREPGAAPHGVKSEPGAVPHSVKSETRPEARGQTPPESKIPPTGKGKDLPPPPPLDTPAPEPAAEVKDGSLKCPKCGAIHKEPVTNCVVCDAVISKAPSPFEESAPEPVAPVPQSAVGTPCPNCGGTVPEGEVKCAMCGTMQGKDDGQEELYKGMTYLVKEPVLDGSMRMFMTGMEKGRKGFCVTRKFPQNLKVKYGMPDDLPVLWLSSVGKENAIRPMDLEKLSLSLEQFLAREPESLIMLEGIEFLVTNNSFKVVLKLIQSLKDQVAINRATLIITVNAATLTASQLNLLERECDMVLSL